MHNRNILGVGLLLGLCFRTLGADGIQPKLHVNSVAAGSGYSLAVASDGAVWAWGGNQFGQLGDGTTTNRLTPVRVSGLQDVVAVAAGCAQSLALASDGTVWVWGLKEWNGGRSPGYLPAPVLVSALTEVVAIAAGCDQNLALKRDGTVWRWPGFGLSGEPSQVEGVTDVVAIAMGGGYGWELAHAVAVRADGTVWTWGSGDPPIAGALPSQVAQVTGAVAVGAGMYDSVALMSDGTLRNWGYVTVRDPSGLSGVASIAVGPDHILALTRDGEVWGAGCNGCVWWKNGTFIYSTIYGPLPEKVVGLTGVAAVATSDTHGLALKQDGTVWAWGSNQSGQLGDGTTEDQLMPVQVTGLPTVSLGGIQSASRVKPIAAGEEHSLAIASEGAVWEWGGRANSSPIPQAAQVSELSGIVAVSGGKDYSLALKSDGTVWRWNLEAGPAQVAALTGIVAVAAGAYHFWDIGYPPDLQLRSLALKQDGTVWMWSEVQPPAQVSGLTEVTAIAAGFDHRLALKSDGTVWALGSNTCGQSGDSGSSGWSVPPNWSTPRQVGGISEVVAISAGGGEHFFTFGHSLALRKDGTVWEWGCDGAAIVQPTPRHVSGMSGMVAIAAGAEHSLALKEDGTVWAWGWNSYGQLGDGTKTYGFGLESVISTPVQVSELTRVIAVAAGGMHSLAVKDDGTLWAWGGNWYGQLGDGSRTQRSTPVQVTVGPASGLNPGLLLTTDPQSTSTQTQGQSYLSPAVATPTPLARAPQQRQPEARLPRSSTR